MKVKRESEVTQSCPTLSDPMDCSLPGSSIHGIFQARVLEWGAIAFSEETLWDNIKCTNIHIIGVPGREEKGSEKISEEVRAENFPNMGKEIVNQVQEVQRVPCSINPRRNTWRHKEIKLTKIKDRDKILKATREKL